LELFDTTLEIPTHTTKIPISRRGSTSSLANGGESVPQDRSSYRGVEGGYEESYLSTQSE
jgi:hypothetical protein